jgi:hypothetical protein
MTYPTFNIAESIEVYLWSWANSNAFIINHSLIGGSDVLATTELEPTLMNCKVSDIAIETGWDLDSAVTFQASSGQMNLTMRAENADSFSNPNIILGRKMSVEIPVIGEQFFLFTGWITSYNFEYLPGNQVLINITCSDALYYINQHISEGDPFPLEPSSDLANQITKILWNYTPPSGAEDFHQLPTILGTPWAQFLASSGTYELFEGRAGSLINQRLLAEQGAMRVLTSGSNIEPEETYLYVYTRDQINKIIQDEVPGDGIQTFNIDTSGESGLCPSLILFDSSLDRITNEVSISLAQDSEEFYTTRDRESQIRFGTSSVVTSAPFESAEYLEEWARYALVSNLSPVLNTIQIPAIARSGDISLAAFMSPGDRANTKIQYNGANIDKNYLIRKVRHSINTDNWIVEASLWSRDLTGV